MRLTLITRRCYGYGSLTLLHAFHQKSSWSSTRVKLTAPQCSSPARWIAWTSPACSSSWDFRLNIALGPSFVFNNPGVTSVDVSGNAIASVDAAAFGSVPRLASLDMRSNANLTLLPRNVFYGLSQLAVLQMDAPLRCTAVGGSCRPSHTPSKELFATSGTNRQSSCVAIMADNSLTCMFVLALPFGVCAALLFYMLMFGFCLASICCWDAAAVVI